MGDSNDGGNNGAAGASCCNEKQQAFLYLYLVYMAIVLLAAETIVAKPLRLLATAIHEISHAAVCRITGGQIIKVEVYDNGGGVTQYRGGCQCLIASAGYLGEAATGMLFTICSGGRRTATAAAAGLIVMLLWSLCYCPNRLLVILNIVYAIITLALIAVEWFYFTPLLNFVTLFFGVFLGVCAMTDIFGHLIVRSQRGSDSYSLYEESGRCCPPRCIGIMWLITAIVMQLFGLWMALILMSEECEDQGWFECVFHTRLDLFDDFEVGEWDWWPDEWTFRANP
jgi:Peptidase M50B-like